MTSAPLPVPGTHNLRDVGGLLASGGVIRERVLMRSDGLGRLGEAGRAALRQLGVDTVVDLRSSDEVHRMPDDLDGSGIRHVHLPIFQVSMAETLSGGHTLDSLYSSIIRSNGVALTDVVRVIATDEGCVLVHCTAGKDRTGIVIALALLAVGVSRTDVAENYAATEANLAAEWVPAMRARRAAIDFAETPDSLQLLGASPVQAIEAIIDHVESEFGSAADYLLAHGLHDLELAALRLRLAPHLPT